MANTFGIVATKRDLTIYKHCGFVQSITTTTDIPSGTAVDIYIEKAGQVLDTFPATVEATTIDWTLTETQVADVPTGCKYYMIVTFPGQPPRPWFTGSVKIQ